MAGGDVVPNIHIYRPYDVKSVPAVTEIFYGLTVIERGLNYYRPPEGGRLYDMKVVSGYAFLRTYYV